jgi:hypothetical protein
MEKRTISTIAILITTAFCGLPGLCGLCFGSLALMGIFVPDNGIPSEDVALTVGVSVMMVGLSLVFTAIPIGIGIWTWWSQKPKTVKMDEISIPEDDF